MKLFIILEVICRIFLLMNNTESKSVGSVLLGSCNGQAEAVDSPRELQRHLAVAVSQTVLAFPLSYEPVGSSPSPAIVPFPSWCLFILCVTGVGECAFFRASISRVPAP